MTRLKVDFAVLHCVLLLRKMFAHKLDDAVSHFSLCVGVTNVMISRMSGDGKFIKFQHIVVRLPALAFQIHCLFSDNEQRETY